MNKYYLKRKILKIANTNCCALVYSSCIKDKIRFDILYLHEDFFKELLKIKFGWYVSGRRLVVYLNP